MQTKKISGLTTGDILAELFDLDGLRVIDAGCGDGKLVRLLAGRGAAAFGIEPNPAQVARARAAKPAGDEQYSLGGAEALPFDADAVDLVVFSNSLHHVPEALRLPALREAARVVKSGGHVFVAEPMPGGAHKDLLAPVQDETEVQAHAYRVIQDAAGHGLRQLREDIFERESFYRDFDHFRDAMCRVDPNRAAAFTEHDADLRRRFATLGRAKNPGRAFDQPIRINVLVKG
jgi:SAM-dependent methyltransferase